MKERSKFRLADGSMKSRKFGLTLLGLFILTGVALCGLKYPAIEAVLPTFVGGLLGILSIYFTGNVMAKHVIGNTEAKLTAVEKEKETVTEEGGEA